MKTIAGGSRRPGNGAAPLPTIDPRRILSSLGEVVYDWDIGSDRLRWGPNAGEVLALDPRLSIDSGRAWSALLSPESISSRQEAFRRAGVADQGVGVNYSVAYAVRTAPEPSAPVVWIDDTGRWFAGADGRPARAHGAIRVTGQPSDRRHSVAAAERPAMSTLAQVCDRAARMADAERDAMSAHALMILSFDATPGLAALAPAERDRVLHATAARIAGRMRRGDLIARVSEDRVALLLEGGNADDARVAFARFAQTVAGEPAATASGPLPILVRAGASVSTGGDFGRDMLASALDALERADASASSPLAINDHTNRAGDRAAEVRRLCDEARVALAEDRFMIALQPIVRAQGHTVGFSEALMRLRSADGANLPPAVLLPAAEETGLITQIDHRVIDLSIRLLEAEPQRVLSVNVSGATLHDPLWTRRIEAALAGRERCAERLIFEITETCAIENLTATGRAIAHLRGLGSRVAMDDFGAGHTSFRNLRALDLDILKIDGAFIQNMATSQDDRFFVRTLHDLARHLGIETVAEWVETMETADLLASWGIEYLQGAAFGLAEMHQAALVGSRDAA